MTPFSELIQQGTSSAWLFVPSAILLGALHGLEPGHSKTMMAAFIVAIRGTVAQAVMLGLSATISHTAIVWIVALLGLHFGAQWNAEATEPYFQLASAVLIIAVALWMLRRTWLDQRRGQGTAHGRDDHDHHDRHHHGGGNCRIDTGHGVIDLEIFEDGVAPRFRLRFENRLGLVLAQSTIPMLSIETERKNGRRQTFHVVDRGEFLESVDPIPEPNEFMARLHLAHGDHVHDYDVAFTEHGHAQALPGLEGLDATAPGYQDAHELAHANDIRRRFAGSGNVSTGQIILFGLTGGLIPCPASITVLLLCLQLKQVTLGLTLVLCFSIGLALTMVASGTIAALSVKHASRRWAGFGVFAQRAPYVSSALIICVGLYTAVLGWSGLAGAH